LRLPRVLKTLGLATIVLALTAAPAAADRAFNQVGSLNVPDNLPPGDSPDTATSSEIVSATPDMGGEPTSVDVLAGYALVAVNTSPSLSRRPAISRS
jgi:hypothetical protein